jgi:hypothetical protein
MHPKHSTCLELSLFMAVMSWPAGTITASETSGFTITIHVYNYAGVPEKTLTRVKHESGRIFRNAGLAALWVDNAVSAGDLRYPHRSTDSWDGTHFVLRLLTQSREGSSINAMGEALSLVEIANVFMNRVIEQAAIGELSVTRMLGHAIAHEIGHLLLGDNSHSPGGIMVAPWSKQDLWHMSKGNLLFTHPQVTRIQAEVRHRSRPALRVAD